MERISHLDLQVLEKAETDLLKIWRITALWGFSEAAFGGVLHALKVPFSGIFISGAAVIFISLLAHYSTQRNDIFKATVTVILIKALISPHSPVTAYFAVLIQGILGQILFYNKRFFKTSALLLGVGAGFFSGFQKLIVLTIVFGNTLWKSVDIFLNYIISQFTQYTHTGIRYSYILAGAYVGIHLISGILFGIAAGRIPFRIQSLNSSVKDEIKLLNDELFIKKKNKRSWLRRPSGIIIIAFSIAAAVLSYLAPVYGNNLTADIIIMIIRSLIIMFLWYTFLSPMVLKLFHKYLSKKSSNYSARIEAMVSMFPRFRLLISHAWIRTADQNGLRRIKNFFLLSFLFLLNDEDLSPDRRN